MVCCININNRQQVYCNNNRQHFKGACCLAGTVWNPLHELTYLNPPGTLMWQDPNPVVTSKLQGAIAPGNVRTLPVVNRAVDSSMCTQGAAGGI